MMVISRVEEGNTLLRSTAEKPMTVFGTALFAQFQCLIWAGVCELAMNVHSYELAEIELGSSCEYFLHYTYYIVI